jgi:phage terminase large subunit-like protein
VCGPTPLAAGRYRHVALVGETAADARDVMVEGPAGLLSVHPRAYRPTYYPSRRLVEWPNGADAHLYNATEPDQLRGPQHDLAWCDELAKWRYVRETWDMLQFGMRTGYSPRQIITTTPRPIPLVKTLLQQAARDPDTTVVTRGRTMDNAAHLAPQFMRTILAQYEGTRLGRQELDAEIIDEAANALWTRGVLDARRVRLDECPTFARVVVGVDPAIKESSDGDSTSATGIIVAGMGEDGRAYVLDDLSCRLSPHGWARKVCAAYDLYDADAVVVEVNQGGAMVESVLRAERPMLPIRSVRATRGKTVRAEPIAALYEQGRVSHAGAFPALEDQMVLFTPFGIEGSGEADRVDALVWALSELLPKVIAHAKHRDIQSDTTSASLGGGNRGWMA